ncbi:MAG: M23 family metallopeptidase [Sandaracinaceae bacterium]|nr:M23 family metallopeptidase [Sandaracinaceae bacterium]
MPRALLAASLLAVTCALTGSPAGRAQQAADAEEPEAATQAPGASTQAPEPHPVAARADSPWEERQRRELGVYAREEVRVGPEDWGPLAQAPAEVDPARFATALRTLCGGMRERTATELTGYVLASAREFQVDPFLLGGLVHQQSGCRSREREAGGVGLTLLPFRTFRRRVRDGALRYFVADTSGLREAQLSVPRHPFTPAHLLRAEANLYHAAALLHALRAEHDAIHRAFPQQQPHRHVVSHFVWGDVVRSSRAEDRILSERRRLLEHYGAYTPPAPLHFRGLPMSAPLHGAPRVILSWRGARRQNRDGSRRQHHGTDIESYADEAVLAAADGRVVVAGVDLPGVAHMDNLRWREIRIIPRDTLGAGGRYVCVQHDPPEGSSFRTCYMHLERVDVRRGQVVTRGTRVGTVGRTGILDSAAHLHFELRDPEEHLDASVVLAGHLIGHRPRQRAWW